MLKVIMSTKLVSIALAVGNTLPLPTSRLSGPRVLWDCIIKKQLIHFFQVLCLACK